MEIPKVWERYSWIMQNALKSNEWQNKEFGSLKLLKLKYRRGDQIIQGFCRIDSPQEIRSPLFNLRKFKKTERSPAESCSKSTLKDSEWLRIWVLQILIKIQKGWFIQLFCRIGYPQEIKSPPPPPQPTLPLFNLRIF